MIMGRVRRKRMHKNIKDNKKKSRTRHRIKDIDQVHQDLKKENAKYLLNQPQNVDLPGLAQFYCLKCARYFVDHEALNNHKKSKVHKRRLKDLKLEPYTQRESEAAAGQGSYYIPKEANA